MTFLTSIFSNKVKSYFLNNKNDNRYLILFYEQNYIRELGHFMLKTRKKIC